MQSGLLQQNWCDLIGYSSNWPLRELQFRWNALSRLIKDEELQIKAICYKLSTPSSNWNIQQAPKHPTSALKKIENLEIHKNPKFIHFQIGLNRKSSLIPPNPQIKVLNLCNSMLSMSMATEGLDLYVESMRCWMKSFIAFFLKLFLNFYANCLIFFFFYCFVCVLGCFVRLWECQGDTLWNPLAFGNLTKHSNGPLSK